MCVIHSFVDHPLCARHILVLVLWRMLTNALAERESTLMGRVEERSRDGQGHPSEEQDASENLCTAQGTPLAALW